MKVLDLQCSQGHSFEGWFGSQGDYDAQHARNLVTCPVCNDCNIVKLPSSPRLNLGASVATASTTQSRSTEEALAVSPAAQPSSDAITPTAADRASLQQLQADTLKMLRHVMTHTEDVGRRFAEEARKIHYGETQERPIRGQASQQEAQALLEEGIELMPLIVPENLKGPLQ